MGTKIYGIYLDWDDRDGVLEEDTFFLNKENAQILCDRWNNAGLERLKGDLARAQEKDKKDAEKYAEDRAKLVEAGFSESDQLRLLGADRTWSNTESLQRQIDNYKGEYRVLEIETQD